MVFSINEKFLVMFEVFCMKYSDLTCQTNVMLDPIIMGLRQLASLNNQLLTKPCVISHQNFKWFLAVDPFMTQQFNHVQQLQRCLWH